MYNQYIVVVYINSMETIHWRKKLRDRKAFWQETSKLAKIKYITALRYLFFGIYLSADCCFKQSLFVGAALHTDSLQWPFKLAGAHIFI